MSHFHIALARNGYNPLMLRAALFTLLVASFLDGSLQAQRAGATFHGNAGAPVRSGFAAQRSFSNRSFPRRGVSSSRFEHRHDGAGSILVPYFFPYDEPYEYDQPYAEAGTNEPAPPVVILQTDDRQARAPEPPAKAQVIEIPGAANATVAKTLPPTIFILANGEQLETRRFVLTASNLSVSIERQQRTIPLDMLDVNATVAANQQRGIDLRIPNDRNEISLSF